MPTEISPSDKPPWTIVSIGRKRGGRGDKLHVDDDRPPDLEHCLWQRVRRRPGVQGHLEVRRQLEFPHHGLALIRRGGGDAAVDAHHAHAEVAGLRDPLQADPVEGMDGEPGALHEDQPRQQDHGRSPAQAARPKFERHAFWTSAART